MSNLVIIRYATTKKNTLSAIEFNNSRIAKVTSTTTGMIPAGIYDNSGLPFKTLAWFNENDFRMDKANKRMLLKVLTDNDIVTITLI